MPFLGQQEHTLRRFFVSFIGVITIMAGTALITHSDLGTAPVSSPIWAITLMGGLSFGGWTFVLNLILVTAQVLLLRPNFPLSGWLQIPALFISSMALDFWMWAFRGINLHTYPARIALILGGIIVLAFGVSLVAACRLIYLPGEGFVASVSERFHFPFHRVKVCFDLSCVTLALILSLAFLHSAQTVREATFLSALLIGPTVGLLIPLSRRLIKAA